MEQLSLFPHAAPQGASISSKPRTEPSPDADHILVRDFPPKGRARKLDQFYTDPKVAAFLFAEMRNQLIVHRPNLLTDCTFLEPSAGTGSFLRLLPQGTWAFDIDPKAPGIISADFLRVQLAAGRQLICIGNPPFGKNASLAVRFYNHAASVASVIAFIVPRTFQKVSVQNRLDLRFHLLHQTEVPHDGFIFEGQPKTVPSVFQIWVRESVQRIKVTPQRKHKDFRFLPGKAASEGDFAIRRVGARAGRISRNLTASKSSHYFMKASPGVADVEHVMRQIDFTACAGRTAGNPSLAQTEIVELYTRYRNAVGQKSAVSERPIAPNEGASKIGGQP